MRDIWTTTDAGPQVRRGQIHLDDGSQVDVTVTVEGAPEGLDLFLVLDPTTKRPLPDRGGHEIGDPPGPER